MQLQFNRSALPYLRQVMREGKYQEVTQEVRLTDSMPDIGNVLLSWGQVLVRGKEWRGTDMTVSGGVLAFVLYAPEDGGEPRCVESWMPFQMKWDLPGSREDGTMLVSSLLKGVDARSTSARKLMVRAHVGMQAQAWEKQEAEVYTPEQVPEDVQLLKRTYPLRLPKEAGEKAFSLEETLSFSAADALPDRLLRYSLHPEIIDRKVMAGKVVFRGAAIVHILYRTEDGELQSKDFEIPFSQYSDLEHIYEEDADASVTMAVTGLELEEMDDGSLLVKAGLVGQYVVFDRPVLELVEDAYSTSRELTPVVQMLDVPAVLDLRSDTMRAQLSVEAKDASQAVDTAFYPEYPRLRRNGQMLEAEQAGSFQMLCRKEDGSFGAVSARWEENRTLAADEQSAVDVEVQPSGKPQGSIMAGHANMLCDLMMQWVTLSRQGMPMVTGMELGEEKTPDPDRPSLILRRMEEEDLWRIAKECGSTVEAIQAANDLDGEPQQGSFLLIPVP